MSLSRESLCENIHILLCCVHHLDHNSSLNTNFTPKEMIFDSNVFGTWINLGIIGNNYCILAVFKYGIMKDLQLGRVHVQLGSDLLKQ